ncbi:hypothetical protein ACHAWF_016411 [Thalassiosira exigua]
MPRATRCLLLACASAVAVESFAPPSSSTFRFAGRDVPRIRRRPRDEAPPRFARTSRAPLPRASCTRGTRAPFALSALPSGGAAASLLSSLHGNESFVLSAVLIVSACGVALEQKTTFGKALSAPLVTMLISLTLANVGVVPFQSPVCEYSCATGNHGPRKLSFHMSVFTNIFDRTPALSSDKLVNRVLVPLAVPLFLFDSDLRRVVRDAGSLLLAFLVGAVSTVVGTLCAFSLIPLRRLGDQGWKVACAITSRHIGGAINFVAVADTLNIDGSVVSAAIAADNVVVALYFALLFYLSTSGEAEGDAGAEKEENASASATSRPSLGEEIDLPGDQEQVPITTSSIAYSVATASCLVTLGSAITAAVCPSLSSLVITSLLTVLSATVFPGWFQRLRTSGTAVGILFLQMFFAASGAAGSLVLVLRQAPSLVAFSALQLAVHFLVLMGVGRGLLRLNLNELFLASNANVGGPTTAAAMAQAKEWRKLVLPALLVGVLGYAMATALSLSLGPILIRLAT